MPDSGPIPGWRADEAPAGEDPAKRTIFGRLSEAGRLYRAHAGPLLGITLLFQGILGLPLAVTSYSLLLASIDMLTGEVDWLDPEAMENMLAVGPFNDLALDYAFLGFTIGMAFLAYALAWATATSMLMAEPDARWKPGPALRATFTYGLGIVVVGIVAMVAFGTIYWLQGVGLARQFEFGPLDARSIEASGRYLLLSTFILVLEVIALYFLVRWSAAVGAMVVEQRSFQASLTRSSELTRGRRRWIAGHLFVASLLVAILVGFLEYVPAFLAAAAFGVGSAAFNVILVVLVVATPLIVTPFAVVYLAALFRDLRDAGPRPVARRVDTPPGWGSGG